MTEYDYSPQAYERHLATQDRIANWVDTTEQHRGEFQSANAGPPDLTRSGPGPASSHSKSKPGPPSPRKHSGQSQPKQPVIHPRPSESDSSSSSDSYYAGPWPAQMHQPSSGVVLPPMQQQAPHPAMAPPTTSPHRFSLRRHRSHERRRHSHHSPTYYQLASPPLTPPLSPGHQYTAGGNQGYVMMPQYSGTQMPVMRSAPASVSGFSVPTAQSPYPPQPQPNFPFLASNSQSHSSQQAWSTYGAAPSPAYSMMSTAVGSPPLQSQPYPGVPTYQPFCVPQQPVQPSYFIPPRAHQRIYDLSKPESDKYYKRSVR